VPRPVTAPFEGFPVGFDRLYGLEILDLGPEEAHARVEVRDELRQPAGLVHGGVFASIAESLTSIATWLAVHEAGKSAQGLSNQTSFLRPIVDGTIHATARRRHRGRTTWVWEVDITDDEGRLCALVRMTVAVREAEEPGPPGRRSATS
jgi:1,4-dihydroxy-2-naphthoyl-CoA hydrolase